MHTQRRYWWVLGPIFWEVEVNSIGGVCDIGDPASNQHDLKSSNRYTTAPLVINQTQLDWPRREGFSCKRIEEHKQERINTQSEIADVYDAKIKVGVQELDSKGLIDIVEDIKNGALDHYKRICRHSYNESISVSHRKLELNKTLI